MAMTTGVGATVDAEPRRQSGASSFMREDIDAGKANDGGAALLHGVGDKDLRETTMMMGIERDEQGMRSEVGSGADLVLETSRVSSHIAPSHVLS